MADETKRLDPSSKETLKLQKEIGAEKLAVSETEKLEEETKSAFHVSLTKGQIVKDRYKVVGVVGEYSGESWRYLCQDIKENKNVVLKLYHSGFTPKEEILKRLIGVTHKDIVNVLDYGYLGSQLYEIMEYAEGGTLLERLQEKPFSEEELIRDVIPQVLNGLKFCHGNDIIHRDIKPANIFYRDKKKNDIVIGDFGISSKLEAGMSVKASSAALTIDYAAPELFGWKGKAYISKKIDYYAFGITLIHLFIGGKTPFPGMTPEQIYTMHTAEKVPLPLNFSNRFKKLISGLLTKELEKRWGASEIERWLRGEDVPVYEDELKVTLSILPYKFTTTAIAKTPKELAMLIQTFEDREVVKKHFSKGWFSDWLGKFDQELAYKITEIEEKASDVDLALLEISYILNPEIPYVLIPGKQAETPQELAQLIDENWKVGKDHIFSGKISIWLRYAGYQEVYERLEQIRREFYQEQNRGVEIFLQLLGLPKPEVSMNPSSIEIGTIESIAGETRKEIKITHTGKRGYLYGEIRFSEEIDGILLSGQEDVESLKVEKQRLIELLRDAERKGDEKAYLKIEHELADLQNRLISRRKESKAFAIRLWPGESIKFDLIIEAEKLQVNKRHKLSIVTKTNAAREINLPISFYVDYPSYSKKRARNVFKI